MEKNQLTDIEEIVAAAKSHTIRELQSMTGLSYHRIWTLLARRGVSPLKGAPVQQRITKEALEAVYVQGPLTVEEAAKALDCSHSSLTSALRRHGMIGDGRKPSVKNRFVGERAFKILAHIKNNQGETMAEIGRKFNCTREYVRQVKECATINGLI